VPKGKTPVCSYCRRLEVARFVELLDSVVELASMGAAVSVKEVAAAVVWQEDLKTADGSLVVGLGYDIAAVVTALAGIVVDSALECAVVVGLVGPVQDHCSRMLLHLGLLCWVQKMCNLTEAGIGAR
jgi:hypothetical protein